MPTEEQVLVFERKVFDKLGAFNGLCFDVERYLRELFSPGVLRFMPRSQAESNTDYKQLIPYVIMEYNGGYLNYVRGKRAGEKRLVGNRSIGIGGHINPVDEVLPMYSEIIREGYLRAVDREVAEEVEVDGKHSDLIVALLNDDSNEVGRVHLGIVHYWRLGSSKVSRGEQMITQMGFMSPDELKEVRNTLETWSRLCLDGLGEMAKRGGSAIGSDPLGDNA